MIQSLKSKVIRQGAIDQEEALLLSRAQNKTELYKAANEIREHFCKSDFSLCSITNAKSGRCTEDCKWCSQSMHHHTTIEEYEIVDPERAVSEAASGAAQGVSRHSLVTSGRRVSNKTLDGLIPMYREIKEKCGIGLCASMGLVTHDQLLRLKNAGVGYYHCNIETAPSLFGSLVSTHTLEEKIETIKMAQAVGMEVCSGGIIGMGESMEQRIEMAFLLRDLGIKSIPINILQPIQGTPLEEALPLSEEEILTTIAIFRFIHPDAWLRFAGGRVQIKHFQNKALKAGINAAITGDYLTSTGSATQEDIKEFRKAGFNIYDGK